MIASSKLCNVQADGRVSACTYIYKINANFPEKKVGYVNFI